MLAPGTEPYLANTLAKVTLTVEPNGRFLLINKGLPLAGELDLNTDYAGLVIDQKAGMKTRRETIGKVSLRPGGTLEMQLTEDDGVISLKKGAQPSGDPNRTTKTDI